MEARALHRTLKKGRLMYFSLYNTIFVPDFQVLYFNCLCLKPMEKRLYSAQNLILRTQPRKISYLLLQNKEIFTFLFMHWDKKKQHLHGKWTKKSKITQKCSEMSSFSRFASVLQITFFNKPPNVVPHHAFVILSMFKVQYILMKALALLLRVSFHVLLEFVNMSVKDMDFNRHSASHFGVIFYESLNQLPIVFSLVITQEAMNNCNETVPSHFLLPVQQLGELVTSFDLLDLRSN